MPDKPLIVIKSKINCMKLNTSGLLLLVIDKENRRINGVDGIFIVGDALKNAKTNITAINFIESININRQNHTIARDYFEIVKSYVIQKTDQKTINSLINYININQIAAVNEVQKLVKSSLNIDVIDVFSEFDTITNAQYNEIIIDQKTGSLPLANQIDIASIYYDNDRQSAEESVKNNKQDIGIAVVYIHSKQFSGILFCFVNCVTKKLLYSYSWIDENNIIRAELDAKDALYDLFYKTARASQRVHKFSAVQQEVQSKVWSIKADLLASAIESEASEDAGKLFKDALVEYNDIQARAELFLTDVVRFHMLYNPLQFDSQKAEHKETVETDKRMVAVDLVLSPTTGKKVSQLQPGDIIFVFIDTSTPYGYDVANALKLIADKKNTPIEAEVNSVHYSNKKGFTILIKITEKLHGQAVEEQDVKVKTRTVIQAEESSSRKSLVIGTIAGIILLGIILYIIVWALL